MRGGHWHICRFCCFLKTRVLDSEKCNLHFLPPPICVVVVMSLAIVIADGDTFVCIRGSAFHTLAGLQGEESSQKVAGLAV